MKIRDLDKEAVIRFGIIIVGMFLGFYAVYMGSIENIKVLRAKLKTEIKRVVLAKEIDVLQKRVAASEEIIGQNTKSETTFIDEVSGLADEYDVKILSTEPLPSKTFGIYEVMSFNVKGIGTYSQIGRFLSSLEASPMIIKVEKLALTTSYLQNLSRVSIRYGEDQSKKSVIPDTIKPQMELIVSTFFIKK